MKKELPGVFANSQEKKFNNNERVYYSKEKISDSLGEDSNRNIPLNPLDSKNIYQKLNDIFNSEKYVYKAEVEVQTQQKKFKTKIIGQNRTHIITMDNQLIPITDIVDIKFSE